MSVFVRTLNGGTNGYNTPASDASWIFNILNWQGIFVSTDYAVTQHTGSDLNVVVNAGNILMSATPTSESARIFGVNLTDNAVVSISSNTSGSTKYDVVYLSLNAATLHNPPALGDFTDAVCLLTERHSSSGLPLSASNGIALAEVAVANGATSITNSNVTDKRIGNAFGPWRSWTPTIYANDGVTVITPSMGTCKYTQTGKTVRCVVNMTAIPNPGGTRVIFSLPVPAAIYPEERWIGGGLSDVDYSNLPGTTTIPATLSTQGAFYTNNIGIPWATDGNNVVKHSFTYDVA
jgi:hypothetical protein